MKNSLLRLFFFISLSQLSTTLDIKQQNANACQNCMKTRPMVQLMHFGCFTKRARNRDTQSGQCDDVTQQRDAATKCVNKIMQQQCSSLRQNDDKVLESRIIPSNVYPQFWRQKQSLCNQEERRQLDAMKALVAFSVEYDLKTMVGSCLDDLNDGKPFSPKTSKTDIIDQYNAMFSATDPVIQPDELYEARSEKVIESFESQFLRISGLFGTANTVPCNPFSRTKSDDRTHKAAICWNKKLRNKQMRCPETWQIKNQYLNTEKLVKFADDLHNAIHPDCDRDTAYYLSILFVWILARENCVPPGQSLVFIASRQSNSSFHTWSQQRCAQIKIDEYRQAQAQSNKDAEVTAVPYDRYDLATSRTASSILLRPRRDALFLFASCSLTLIPVSFAVFLHQLLVF